MQRTSGRGRRRVLSEQDELDLVRARDTGVSWKQLGRAYRLGRTQLWEAYRRGKARISEHLSPISEHPDHGPDMAEASKLAVA
jgi:hypothetical protein